VAVGARVGARHGRPAGLSRPRLRRHGAPGLGIDALTSKRPFEIGRALSRIRRAVRPLPKAAMFALAEDGHRSLFEQLVGCILSIRTLDEVSLVAARRLFAAAPDPAA